MASSTALLLVDAQVNMFAPDAAVYRGEEMLATLRDLVERARSAGVPVIYIQNNGGPDEPDLPGTPGWEIHPDLAPRPDDIVIQKHTPNSFYQTPLLETLRQRDITALVIAGMQTEYCIDTTTRQAAALDFAVTLVADGHSTYDTSTLTAAQVIAHHNAVLRAFARVIPAADISGQLGS
jgi:nicotinamidase-related amidase